MVPLLFFASYFSALRQQSKGGKVSVSSREATRPEHVLVSMRILVAY